MKDSALEHLGMVLHLISDMHPGHRCQALDDAVAYYKENAGERQYSVDSDCTFGQWRKVHVSGLGVDVKQIERALEKLTVDERAVLDYSPSTVDYFYKSER